MEDNNILIDDAVDWEDCQVSSDRAAVATLINQADALAAKLPLTAVLSPYQNPISPDTVFRSVVLTDLFADHTGQGVGSKWLKAVGDLCDAADITLYTDAACTRSCAFYLARGFEKATGQRHQLVRWPPPSPELAALLARDAEAK